MSRGFVADWVVALTVGAMSAPANAAKPGAAEGPVDERLPRARHARQVQQGRRAQDRAAKRAERARPEPRHVGRRRLLRAGRQGRSSRGPRLAGVGGRAAREPARGPLGARPGQGGHGHAAAGLRLLPRLAHRLERLARTSSSIPDASVGVRPPVGDERRGRGPAARRAAAAQRGGRKVVLGGHSLGGSITTAYATWDFGGRPGAATWPAWSTSTAAAARRRSTRGRRRRSAARPAVRLTLAGVRRHRRAVRRPLQRHRRARRAARSRRAVARAGLPAAARQPQAAGPGRPTSASSATRSTPRPRRRRWPPPRRTSAASPPSGDPRGWDAPAS